MERLLERLHRAFTPTGEVATQWRAVVRALTTLVLEVMDRGVDEEGYSALFEQLYIMMLCLLGGAGVWVRGLPLGLGGLLVWLLLGLRRRLVLWARFQLWWLVVVGPGRGWPFPRPRVLVVVWIPPVGPQLVWSFRFR